MNGLKQLERKQNEKLSLFIALEYSNIRKYCENPPYSHTMKPKAVERSEHITLILSWL